MMNRQPRATHTTRNLFELPVRVTYVAMPHRPSSVLTHENLRDWRALLGQIRHGGLNFANIICGSRVSDRQLADIAGEVFATRQIFNRWANVGNIVARGANESVFGDVTSFLEHMEPGKRNALVLEYADGILVPNEHMSFTRANPGTYATYHWTDGLITRATMDSRTASRITRKAS